MCYNSSSRFINRKEARRSEHKTLLNPDTIQIFKASIPSQITKAYTINCLKYVGIIVIIYFIVCAIARITFTIQRRKYYKEIAKKDKYLYSIDTNSIDTEQLQASLEENAKAYIKNVRELRKFVDFDKTDGSLIHNECKENVNFVHCKAEPPKQEEVKEQPKQEEEQPKQEGKQENK